VNVNALFRIAVLSATIPCLACNVPDTNAARANEDLLYSDLSLNSWTNRAPMPTPRKDATSVTFTNSAGRKLIYVMGGVEAGGPQGQPSAAVEAYDPDKNQWLKKSPMPVPVFLTSGAVVLGQKIYVMGGWLSLFDDSPIGGFWEYEPATDTWRTKPDPVNFGQGASGVIGGQIYVFLGNTGTNTQFFQRWDPATGQWVFLAQSLASHDGAGGAVIGGKFYLFGETDVLEVYDPATDTWTAKAPRLISAFPASAVINGKIHVFHGGTSVDIYDPSTDTWSPGTPMPSSRVGVTAAPFSLRNGKQGAFVFGGAGATPGTFSGENQLYDPSVP
jgi:N-acetylneuraminic acid mutarotase